MAEIIKNISNKINFPIIELFKSIQGEGKYAGTPSIFIRVTGCNLKCVFKNSICDTFYTSFKPEYPKYSYGEYIIKINNLLNESKNINHIVITGGEPLLYKNGIKQLLNDIYINDKKFIITIETNGTLSPFDNDFNKKYNIFYSISPKLSTSVDINKLYLNEYDIINHNKNRLNIDNLKKFINTPNFQFKFVYSGEECIHEINGIMEQISYNGNNIWLMPEGGNNEQLTQIRQETVNKCLDFGWNYTDRLHIIIWGDKREV